MRWTSPPATFERLPASPDSSSSSDDDSSAEAAKRAAAVAKRTFRCNACLLELRKPSFSTSQFRKNAAGRRCKECVDGEREVYVGAREVPVGV